MIRPVLLVALPLAYAFLIQIFRNKLMGRYIALTAAATNSIIASYLLCYTMLYGKIEDYIGGFSPPLGILLVGDPFSLLLSLIISIVTLIAISHSKGDTYEGLKYHTLILTMFGGANGMILTADMFNLFVFMEITSVSAYALVAHRGTGKGYISSFRYMVMGSVGSTLMLVGISLIYAHLRTLNFFDIASKISSLDIYTSSLAFASIFVGLGVEAEIFPLNGWVPGAYENAPYKVSAILSSVNSKAAIFALFRIAYLIFVLKDFMWFVALLGLLTMLIGEISAFFQSNLRRMLAYSSIGQMGMALMAMGFGNIEAVVGAFVLLISHALSKSLLFLYAGYSEKHGEGSILNPLIGIPVIIGIFSIIGLPPFIGFYGKLFIVFGGLNAKQTLFVAIFLAATLVEVSYYARFLKRIFTHRSIEVKPEASEYMPIILLAALIILFGLYPHPILDILSGIAWYLRGGV